MCQPQVCVYVSAPEAMYYYSCEMKLLIANEIRCAAPQKVYMALAIDVICGRGP